MSKTKLTPSTKQTDGYFSNWDRNLLSLTHELSGPLTAARLNLGLYISGHSLVSLDLLDANLKLMEDYLTTARQQIKHQPMPARVFSVNKQLADIIKNLSTLAAQRSVVITMTAQDDFGLRGNATSFKQIISCFIRNAIEAYDNYWQDNKVVRIEHHISSDYLIITILDHGHGIAESDKMKIFKPYFSTKRNSSGLGLGLSLAAESITEDFKGKVRVESVKSKGTIFKLYFKLPPKTNMLK